MKEFQGAEGTWRDAEDGLLARNAIAQGSVDSTIGLRVQVPAGGRAVCHYWLAAGTRFNDVKTINSVVLGKTPAALITRTRDFWTLWANKSPPDFEGLPAGGRLALQAQSAHHPRPHGQPRRHPRRERLGPAPVRP